MKQTPNYNLPQFEVGDKFNKETLNEGYSKIDLAISDLQETFNANATGGALTTQEVVNARNGKQNLKERIDEIDEQYKDIVTNDIPSITEKLDNKAMRMFVTYEEFGAKLDGISDDSNSILLCHQYANQNNIPVKQNRGTIYIKTGSKIPVKTSLDLSGTKILINESLESRIIYSVITDTKATINVNDKTPFVKGNNNISFLSEYNHYIFEISTDKISNYRPGEVGYNQYYKEVITTSNNGELIDGALFETCSDANKITLIGNSILENSITIKLGSVVLDTTSDVMLPQLFNVERSNVTINGSTFSIKNIGYSALTGSKFKGCLIQFDRCYNSNINGFNGENFTKRLTSQDGSYHQSGYILAFDSCSNVNVNNCTINRGWGFEQTEYCKGVKFSNCNVNRIDNHYGCRDFIIENCTIFGKHGIHIGFGDGYFKIKNVTFVITEDEDTYNKLDTNVSLVRNRSDTGVTYQGKIEISNITVVNNCSNIDTIHVLQMVNSENANYNTFLDSYIPSVLLNGISFRGKPFNNLKLIIHVIGNKDGNAYINCKTTKIGDVSIKNVTLPNYSKNYGFQILNYNLANVIMPSSISIDNYNDLNKDINSYCCNLDIRNQQTSGNVFIKINNSIGNVLTTYSNNSIVDVVINNSESRVSTQNLGSIINSLTMYNSKYILIGSSSNEYITSINLYNCTGGFPNCNNLKVYNSSLDSYVNYQANSFAGRKCKIVSSEIKVIGFLSNLYDTVDISNSTIEIVNTGSPTNSIVNLDATTYLRVINNVIKYNTSLPITLVMYASTRKIIQNNFIFGCTDSTVNSKLLNTISGI